MSTVLPSPAATAPPRGERLAAAALRLAALGLAGLLLAGMVHIVTVLLVPGFASRDATALYHGLGSGGRAELPARRNLPVPADGDPYAVVAVCGYDLAAGPIRVQAPVGRLPLSLSVHRAGGGVLYAITDRAAVRGVVEFVVMTEAQMDQRAADDENEDLQRELRVVSDSQRGLIVARALAKLPSDRGDAEALATSVACGSAD